jgi:two-component system chemotaxis sensor kinase CheA
VSGAAFAGPGGDEILREFLSEGQEIAGKLDRDLVALEAAPGDRELLGAVFRGVHTLKGNAGFLGFSRIEELAHAGESLLGGLRDGARPVGPQITGALLALVDALRGILGSIEDGGGEGGADVAPLRARLEALARGETAAPPEPAPDTPSRGVAASDGTVRVDVGLLDRLMSRVGELVLARNRLAQLLGEDGRAPLAEAAKRLGAVTAELQEGVMKARMQPLQHLWSRYPRLLRDLSLACGKPVRLTLEGEDTELDRSVLEAISDPLVHMIRNAVDHGLETPEERRRAGKPAEGRLHLRALHEGGQVHIEVEDDGRGIDPERLRLRAVESGRLGAEQAARLDERQALDLIFLPGFSTAKEVTTLSGRGVGMDVVRANLDRIGGGIEIQTRPGRGTLFRLRIPLTLAIIPALVVSSRGERYALPQAAVRELVRVEDVEGAVETFHGAPVWRLRGRLLPVVFLDGLLGLSPSGAPRTGAMTLAVLQAGESPFALAVDGVHDTAEIVVEPLPRRLREIGLYAGATLLGDGRVVLILDVPGTARKANVVAPGRDCVKPAEAAAEPLPAAPRRPLLLMEASDGGRLAVPLERVTRLESFPRTALERTGARDVVQYRGDILPLVDLAGALPERRRAPRPGPGPDADAPLRVVVTSYDGRRVGLIVDSLLDIVDEASATRPASRRGVLGCAVIRERVTELVDVDAVLRERLGAEEPA